MPEDQVLWATLTLEMEVSTVGVGVALPVVLQAAVDGQLLQFTVQPVSHVMTFTFTPVLALRGRVGELKKALLWAHRTPCALRATIQHRRCSEG